MLLQWLSCLCPTSTSCMASLQLLCLTETKSFLVNCGKKCSSWQEFPCKWAQPIILKLIARLRGSTSVWRHSWDALYMLAQNNGSIGYTWLNSGTIPVGTQHWKILLFRCSMDIVLNCLVFKLLMLARSRNSRIGWLTENWCNNWSNNTWHVPKTAWSARRTKRDLRDSFKWVTWSFWNSNHMFRLLWPLEQIRNYPSSSLGLSVFWNALDQLLTSFNFLLVRLSILFFMFLNSRLLLPQISRYSQLYKILLLLTSCLNVYYRGVWCLMVVYPARRFWSGRVPCRRSCLPGKILMISDVVFRVLLLWN